jgi:hypothetical protein
MRLMAVAALSAMVMAAGGLGQAEAKGCLKGAVVGGVAGHVAGHHGALGAAAGCAIGHHEANKDERTQQAQHDNADRSAPTER